MFCILFQVPVTFYGQAYQNLSEYLVLVAGNTSYSQSVFNKHNLVVLQFIPVSNTSANAWAFFNAQAYHAIAETLSTLTNVVLASFAPSSLVIQTRNYPLPRSQVGILSLL